MMEWSFMCLSKQTKNPKKLWKETAPPKKKKKSFSIIFILGQAIWKEIPAFWFKPNNVTLWVYQNRKC